MVKYRGVGSNLRARVLGHSPWWELVGEAPVSGGLRAKPPGNFYKQQKNSAIKNRF